LKFTSQFNGGVLYLGKFQFRGYQNIWLAADPIDVGAAYPSTNTNLSQGRQQYFKWNLTNYFTYNKVFADIHDIEVTAGIETSIMSSRTIDDFWEKRIRTLVLGVVTLITQEM
jgi:hypothetical protein